MKSNYKIKIKVIQEGRHLIIKVIDVSKEFILPIKPNGEPQFISKDCFYIIDRGQCAFVSGGDGIFIQTYTRDKEPKNYAIHKEFDSKQYASYFVKKLFDAICELICSKISNIEYVGDNTYIL